MLNIFQSYGVVTDPNQMRPATDAQMALLNVGSQQATSLASWEAYAAFKWPRPPEKPLDERFADFKARLAAAIESRKRA